MPELPEVETIVRALAPRLAGARVVASTYWPSRVYRDVWPPDLAGTRIQRVRRYGKYILVELEGSNLAIHLGMTGKLLFDVPRSKYTRGEWDLGDFTLSLEDVRQFGRVLWGVELPDEIRRLGPDPLEETPASFAGRAKLRKTGIKSVLLDQRFVRGLGNIYSDEALFRARIHPATKACSLSGQALRGLHQRILELIEEAIALGGSSISDYVDTAGNRGSFQQEHRVYAREGEPCVVCGSPILKIVLVQRGTHYCGRCQRV
jgi:formamidopyrimidine-DNA glycosylase